jgi:putative membrane protein
MSNVMQARVEAEKDADPRLDLAVDRTILALIRTLLAWVRTILSLMTAGLAIDKGFAALHEARLVSGTAVLRNSHFAGLVMTGSGTLLIAIVLFNYTKSRRDLNKMKSQQTKLWDTGFILSLIILLIGLLMLYFMIFG